MDETGQKSTLSVKQSRAIAAILEENTVAAGLRKARVSRSAYYSWLQDDAFATALKQRQTALHEAAIADLKAMLARAVKELGALLASRDERTRLSAVKEVLDRTESAFEHHTVIARIEELEKQVEKMEAK